MRSERKSDGTQLTTSSTTAIAQLGASVIRVVIRNQ